MPPANFNKAVLAAKSLMEIIRDETRNYGMYGMLGPDLVVELASMCENLDPKVMKSAEEYLTGGGLSQEAAQHVVKYLPNVAAELIRCVIQGQKP